MYVYRFRLYNLEFFGSTESRTKTENSKSKGKFEIFKFMRVWVELMRV